jgi:flagellar hook assembly protein FlgD
MRAALHQNAPNPFNPSTRIRYEVPEEGARVTIRVFDVAGRLVKTLVDRFETAGQKTLTWDGRDECGEPVASGVYFCRMQAPGFTKTVKVTLVR